LQTGEHLPQPLPQGIEIGGYQNLHLQAFLDLVGVAPQSLTGGADIAGHSIIAGIGQRDHGSIDLDRTKKAAQAQCAVVGTDGQRAVLTDIPATGKMRVFHALLFPVHSVLLLFAVSKPSEAGRY